MLTVILMLGTAVALAPAKAVYVGGEIEIEIDLDKYYDDDGTGKYYGRTALSGLSNSTALLYAYDKIVEGVTNSAEQISVYNGKDSLSSDEFATVFGAYLHDYPEHFWINNAYSVKINTATVISMTPHYTMSGDNLTAAKEAFKNAATELLQGITTSMSEYERELLIHDRVADAIPDGTYTLRVSKPDHITREYTVTVNGGNAQQDAKIHLKGDVNGDGRVNMSDISRINLYAKGKISRW